MINYGIEATFLDMTDLKSLEEAIKPNTKVSVVFQRADSLGMAGGPG